MTYNTIHASRCLVLLIKIMFASVDEESTKKSMEEVRRKYNIKSLKVQMIEKKVIKISSFLINMDITINFILWPFICFTLGSQCLFCEQL